MSYRYLLSPPFRRYHERFILRRVLILPRYPIYQSIYVNFFIGNTSSQLPVLVSLCFELLILSRSHASRYHSIEFLTIISHRRAFKRDAIISRRYALYTPPSRQDDIIIDIAIIWCILMNSRRQRDDWFSLRILIFSISRCFRASIIIPSPYESASPIYLVLGRHKAKMIYYGPSTYWPRHAMPPPLLLSPHAFISLRFKCQCVNASLRPWALFIFSLGNALGYFSLMLASCTASGARYPFFYCWQVE